MLTSGISEDLDCVPSVNSLGDYVATKKSHLRVCLKDLHHLLQVICSKFEIVIQEEHQLHIPAKA